MMKTIKFRIRSGNKDIFWELINKSVDREMQNTNCKLQNAKCKSTSHIPVKRDRLSPAGKRGELAFS
jgi:hypothetical protein